MDVEVRGLRTGDTIFVLQDYKMIDCTVLKPLGNGKGYYVSQKGMDEPFIALNKNIFLTEQVLYMLELSV